MSTEKKELGIGDWAVVDYAGMFEPRIWSEKSGIEIDVEAQDVCIEHPGCDPASRAPWGGGCSTSIVYVPLEVLAEVLRRNGYQAERLAPKCEVKP